ncbi:phosphoadenosine phosphosulfate reductase family protein [Amycolatopsis nalaikhensis]|uniref:Phosphoadenosine phosphosulfate reductase family protein n=1 Tax=Amycolatopsis nalaikhensis TaxID=715472 RepID=A0ABY8Y2A8_9PSEU|nr:phosphoadenosine phosphosulfate reductase family protein [Amycolatopsis sp. 2-2]WIV61921.1 phosphoadenosine phosphosulfate reductase family protein [Amycolatopsis sp. 2-2]
MRPLRRQPDCHSQYQLGDEHSPQTSIARCQQSPLSRDEAASSGRRTVDTWLPIHDWTEDQVWQRIRQSGVPYHPAYDQGMTRLSCSLCVLASRADLIRAAQLRPDLAAEYAAVEAEIGHRFRNDMSMSDIITAAAASSAVSLEGAEHAAVVEARPGPALVAAVRTANRPLRNHLPVHRAGRPGLRHLRVRSRRFPRPTRRRRAGNPAVRPLW